MYTLVYYYRETTGSRVVEREFRYADEFRLRRTALHYLLDIVQNDYREDGYGTEVRVSSIVCYKSKRISESERKIIEVLIKVEKV